MPDGNPYARMVSVMRDEAGEPGGAGPVKMRLGTVAQRAPLELIVAGVSQPAEALKINERLTKGAKWKTRITSPSGGIVRLSGPSGSLGTISGSASGEMTCDGEGCTPELSYISGGPLNISDALIEQAALKETEFDQAEQEQLELDLEKGDTVLLLTEDDQVFYILMKVVSAV